MKKNGSFMRSGLPLFMMAFSLLSCGNANNSDNDAKLPFDLPAVVASSNGYDVPRLNASLYGKVVEVVFADGTVSTSDLPSGVTAEINGADIVLRSEFPGVEFVVRGASSDGSLTIISKGSPLVTLDDLSLVARERNTLQVSSEETIFLRTKGSCRIADISSGIKADNQSAAVKLMGDAMLCDGALAVNAARRSAVFCTGTLYVDDMSLSLNGAPNNAVLTNGSFVFESGSLCATSSKDVIKCKKGDFVMLGGSVSVSSVNDKCDGVQAVNVYKKGGALSIDVAGAASDGIKATGNLCIDGGDISVVTRGDALFNDKKSDYSSAACLKSDLVVEINGGNCSFRSEGNGAKGISSDSLVVIRSGNVKVVTKGGDVNDPVDVNAHTSSKGIKSDGSLYFAGGNVDVLVFGEGERSEGVEAKAGLYVCGDCNLYVYAYDDAMNADSLFFAGGKVYAYSVANDAIDSNAKVLVSGGMVVADGSFSPEQGMDVDNYSAFTITGGTLFSVGGAMGSSPSMPLGKETSVPAYAWNGSKLEKGNFLSLVDDKGVALYSYNVQRDMDGASCLVVSPQLGKSHGYSFVVSSAVAGGDYAGNGISTGARPQDVIASVGFEPLGLVNVVDINGGVKLLEVGSNMGFFPPPGMFPGDSAMIGGQGFPPFPPGMFPGDSAAMADMGFPPFSPDMFPGGAGMDAQGFPPFSPGVFPGDGAGMPEGFEFPPKGNFPPPMPMRRIVSDFSEDNLPNYDKR